MASNDTEEIRRQQMVKINSNPNGRKALEAAHGHVWDTNELALDFEVLGFMAPYVVVRRKIDGAQGSLAFQHEPRLYFAFVKD